MNDKQINLAGIAQQSMVNGVGLRKVYFSQGCTHHCKNCFNPETWPINGGFQFNMDELIEIVNQETYLDGVTFSGGDPLEQPDKFAYMAKKLKENNWNIWCYTGYTWEELLVKMETNNDLRELIHHIDVLVDGKFVDELKSTIHKYRGSSNQRLIDVPKTLNANKIVEFPTK